MSKTADYLTKHCPYRQMNDAYVATIPTPSWRARDKTALLPGSLTEILLIPEGPAGFVRFYI